MKNTVIFFCIVFVMSSCLKMNDNIQDYLDRGEINYIGKVDSAFTLSGKERIVFKWKMNTDPRIEKCVIYWNNYRDSVSFPVSASALDENGFQSAELHILEGTYIFNMHHVGSAGHRSVHEEVTGRSYGALYEQSLTNRMLKSAKYENGNVIINWSMAAEGELGMQLEYTDIHGVKQTLLVPETEMFTSIPDMDIEKPFSYSARYRPDVAAIDIFNAPIIDKKFSVRYSDGLLDKGKFKENPLFSDNHSVFIGWGLPLMWDNDFSTLWHSDARTDVTIPFTFTLDLGVTAKLSRFTLWQRLNFEYQIHNLRKFKVYGAAELSSSTDEEYWSEGWKNDWFLLSDCEVIKPSGSGDQITQEDLDAANLGHEFDISVDASPVRYIRIHVESTWNGPVVYVNVAELSFWESLIVLE